jgi:OOP family OmpA-OmpF porin
MRNALVIVVALVFAGSAPAFAAEGLYLGLSGGSSKAASWCDDVVVDCEDVGNGWKAYIGGQFHPNLGVEAGYVDLGEFTGTDTSLGFPVDGKVEVTGITIAGVGTLPIAGPFALLGKLGLLLASVDLSASGGGLSGSISESSTDFFIGVGAKLAFMERFFIRAEWERFADVGDDDTGEDDVDFFSAGVGVSF